MWSSQVERLASECNIPAIAVGQASRLMRPRHQPSPGPLASSSAAMQGHRRKHNLSMLPGMPFAVTRS
jgi:hypothetical protein